MIELKHFFSPMKIGRKQVKDRRCLPGDASDVVSEDSATIFATIAHAYSLARQIVGTSH